MYSSDSSGSRCIRVGLVSVATRFVPMNYKKVVDPSLVARVLLFFVIIPLCVCSEGEKVFSLIARISVPE